MRDRLFIVFQYLVPQHLLTGLAGLLAESRWRWLNRPFMAWFIRRFDVDMSEAANPDPDSYPTFNAFFTRALKPGARPLKTDDRGIACPADGAISQIGSIEQGRIFQAKGKSFDAATLLGCRTLAAKFEDGLFTTIYLSPRDYHRLHMPVAGQLLETRYLKGKLFSVNTTTAESIDGLFALNERLVMHFDTELGPMAAVMVGAMIVGGMETVWDSDPANSHSGSEARDWRAENIRLAQGQELGRFHLGSTIILCFSKDSIRWEERLAALDPVQMGMEIGLRLSE